MGLPNLSGFELLARRPSVFPEGRDESGQPLLLNSLKRLSRYNFGIHALLVHLAANLDVLVFWLHSKAN